MKSTFELRCPYCLHVLDVPANTSVQAMLNCPKCTQRFELQHARPAELNAARPAGMSRSAMSAADMLGAQALIFGMLGSVVLGLLIALATIGIRGPEFVLIFAFESCAIFYAQYVVRHTYQDSMLISFFAFVCLATTATTRFIYGIAHDMQDFSLMFIILIAASIACFARDDGRRGNGSSGCSSGGGCGRGGGGGCGGCGGD